MKVNIPNTSKKRVVIVGGGFGGLTLANKLDKNIFQTVLIDKNNYHQFQPLLYQVSSAGLQISSIIFPFRKLFRKYNDLYFRLCEVTSVNTDEKVINTTIGKLSYDYLVIAAGTQTNYFGNDDIMQAAIPMKNAEDALELKNKILVNFEKLLYSANPAEKQILSNICIVGGGATGVEIAGAFAEMIRYIVPKDYRDLSSSDIHIYLIEGSRKLLGNMSESSSEHAKYYLEKMGIHVMLNKMVVDYKNNTITFQDGQTLLCCTLIWVSGVIANRIEGINKDLKDPSGRILVDEYNKIQNLNDVFAIGDICRQEAKGYPKGHPQVAPVAVQQAKLLAKNLKYIQHEKPLKKFKYNNQGTMATIGRNKAVADLKRIHLWGFLAWAIWMVVHLRSIFGVKNKLFILIDWIWSYFTYDRSTRYIINSPKQEVEK